jgi:enamine deaminase RidA (YjgF/YER057c/UK114 family)
MERESVTGTRAIDSAIDRLDAALRAAGLRPLEAATDTDVLAEIADAISPYALPNDVARFWERVYLEQDDFPVSGWRMGSLTPPRSALEVHHLNLEPDFALVFGPPLLFPIARHAETQWSVELRSQWSVGGGIFSHDDDIRVEYPTFADLVDVYAELVKEGAYLPDEHRPALLREEEQQKQLGRLDDLALRRMYGPSPRVSVNPSGWPTHWLASAGIDPASRSPLGATHTIAGLLAAAASGPTTGRVHGEIVRLVGIGGDCLVVIEDGTGQLGVWCPAGTSPWGPSHRQLVELEVRIDQPVEPVDLDSGRAEIVHQAFGGNIEGAQAAVSSFFDRLVQTRPSAMATDIRPLD